MIERLLLRSWRSFDELDVELGPGTTFVVAANGVGKTSLVLGLAWAVYGDALDLDPKSCIRAGASATSAEAHLRLGTRQLVVRREAKRRGKPSSTYHLDGETLSDDDADRFVTEQFGAELSVAANLSTMLGGGHIASQTELNLKSHLHKAFGVQHLLANAETAKAYAKQAEKSRAAVKTGVKDRLADREELESELNDVTVERGQLQQRGAELQALRTTADRDRQLAAAAEQARREFEAYEASRASLIEQTATLLDDGSAGPDALMRDLEASAAALRTQVTESTAEQTNQSGLIAASGHAIELLAGDAPICPTCLRPLELHERETARQNHQSRRSDGATAVNEIESRVNALQKRLAQTSELLDRLQALTPPELPNEIQATVSLAEAQDRYDEAVAENDRHNQLIGRADSRLRDLEAQLRSDAALQAEQDSLRLAFRREALAAAAAEALDKLAAEVIEDRIDPIATEVRWRWKLLFDSEGLTLKPDGSIVRIEAGAELGWDTLSGGERTWARIVTHLLVLATTTALPFAWFDEPLEHLDPTLRQSVASALATAAADGAPKQILVTTYESTLARQLADDSPTAQLITLRTTADR